MNKTSKESPFQVHIGSSSILLIFVILCLVSFATLAIVSANADYKLSAKVADRTTAYYEANNLAQQKLAQLDAKLTALYAQASNKEEYFSTAGHEESFLIPLSDIQGLWVSVNILYPETPPDTCYEITAWQVITTDEPEYENVLPVMP